MTEIYGSPIKWQTAPLTSHPQLSEDELHLWWLPLKLDLTQQAIAKNLLNDTQKDKYNRRRTKELQLAYLAGRYYLLHLLGQYINTPPTNIILSYTELNKPYLSNKEFDLQFNYSDTKIDDCFYGAFVFCKKRDVGIDIEWLKRKANFRAITESRFTKEEQAYVFQGTQTDTLPTADGARCLAIWTRKEAFGKALGKGINFKMNALNLINGHTFDQSFNSHNNNWHLQQIQLAVNTISCVAYQGLQPLGIKGFNTVNHLP